MGKPAFLNTNFGFYSVSNYTDVSQILADLATLLPAAGWSTISTDRYRSKATAAGRYVECAFSHVSQAELQMVVYNMFQKAVSTRRMDITTTAPGSNVRYFQGDHHIFIDCQTSVESLGASVIEPSPLADGDILWSSAVLWGTRDSAGTANGYDFRAAGGFAPNDGSYYFGTGWPVVPTASAGGTSAQARDVKMDYLFWPYTMQYNGFVGRPYQCLIGDAGTMTRWTNVNVPLGDGTTGIFMRVSLQTALNVALFWRLG